MRGATRKRSRTQRRRASAAPSGRKAKLEAALASDALYRRRAVLCEEWLTKLASKLMLYPMWTIQVSPQSPADGDSLAEVARASYTAKFFFSPAFYEAPPEQQRSIAAHELAHVIMQPVDQVAEALQEEQETWYKLFSQASEDVVEFLERILRDQLPLPPKFPK